MHSCCQSFVSSRKLTCVSDSHNPLALCSVTGPEVGKRTCRRHHYLHSSWLHLPEPPPTCLMLLRFMWLYRRRPIQCARPCVCFLLYWQLCVWYCSCLPVRLDPVYLKSVISESLKRLGQFKEDKWWIGRTADVGTQTLQKDGVDWGRSLYPTTHRGGLLLDSPSYQLQQLQMGEIIPSIVFSTNRSFIHTSHSITLIKTNDKEWLLGFHNVFCIIKLVNCIAQNKWAE